jgi:hypothetical protein
MYFQEVVTYLGRLVACFSLRMLGLNPTPVRVGLVTEKVALGRVFLRVQSNFVTASRKGLNILVGIHEC